MVKAAGYSLVGEVFTRRARTHGKYFAGPGTLEALKGEWLDQTPEVVLIFNHRLTPAQTRNVQDLVDHLVVDRDHLILEIFQRHARTREAKLQLELAEIQLERARRRVEISKEYESERPARGYHGTGYGKFSAVKRHYSRREKLLRAQLRKVRARRANQRKRRETCPSFSLVGYTNSGKTSLLNALAGSDLVARDEAFTTISPRTRRVRLSCDGTFVEALGSDTVGFISGLPPRATGRFFVYPRGSGPFERPHPGHGRVRPRGIHFPQEKDLLRRAGPDSLRRGPTAGGRSSQQGRPPFGRSDGGTAPIVPGSQLHLRVDWAKPRGVSISRGADVGKNSYLSVRGSTPTLFSSQRHRRGRDSR